MQSVRIKLEFTLDLCLSTVGGGLPEKGGMQNHSSCFLSTLFKAADFGERDWKVEDLWSNIEDLLIWPPNPPWYLESDIVKAVIVTVMIKGLLEKPVNISQSRVTK